MKNRALPTFILSALLISELFSTHAYSQVLKSRAKTKVSEESEGVRPQRQLAPSTPHSYYKKDDFCSADGAGKLMNELDRENQERFLEAKSIKDKIEELSAQTTIINQVSALRKTYEDGMIELIRDKDKKRLKPELQKDLTSFKKIFRSGLTLNALSLMMKDVDLSKDESFKMSQICQSHQTQAVCNKSDSPSNMFQKRWVFFGEDTHALDAVLDNFKAAYRRSGSPEDKAKLKGDVEKIIKSIPDNIAPGKILTVIQQKAPELYQTLAGNIPGDLLMKCLDEKSFESDDSLLACNEIVSDPKSRAAFQTIVNQQTASMKELLGEKFKADIDQVQEARSSELTKAFTSFDKISATKDGQFKSFATDIMSRVNEILKSSKMLSQLKGSGDSQEERLKKLMAANSSLKREEAVRLVEVEMRKADDELDGLSKMFYEPPMPTDDERQNDLRQKQAILKAKTKSRDFNKLCDFSKPDYTDSSGRKLAENERIKKCQAVMEETKPKVDALISLHASSLKELEDKLKDLNSGRFKDIELLKKFLAEKYICECTAYDDQIKSKNESIVLDQSLSTCGEVRYKATFNIQTIEAHAKDVGKVLSKNFGLTIETDKKKCDATFSKANMADFENVCNVKAVESRFPKVCEMVKAENKIVADKKDEAYYDKLYKENYVDYDPKRQRYVSTKKMSTGRLIANGAIPVAAATLIPAWINDYQTRTQIDSLTNQALFIKQYQHTMGFYNNNPWMYSIDYFGNPFNNFSYNYSLPSSSTTTNKIGTGFSF